VPLPGGGPQSAVSRQISPLSRPALFGVEAAPAGHRLIGGHQQLDVRARPGTDRRRPRSWEFPFDDSVHRLGAWPSELVPRWRRSQSACARGRHRVMHPIGVFAERFHTAGLGFRSLK
jgi:hypothetical protein